MRIQILELVSKYIEKRGTNEKTVVVANWKRLSDNQELGRDEFCLIDGIQNENARFLVAVQLGHFFRIDGSFQEGDLFGDSGERMRVRLKESDGVEAFDVPLVRMMGENRQIKSLDVAQIRNPSLAT